MFEYDKKGNKIRMEHYASSTPQKQVRFKNTVENYGDSDHKKKGLPVWAWVLIVVAILVVLVLIYLYVFRTKNSGGMSTGGMSPMAAQRFGFRFY